MELHPNLTIISLSRNICSFGPFVLLGVSLRFSHVKTSAFPSPALTPLLSIPLCVLVGHLVWMPSYDLPESRRKQSYHVTSPAGSFSPIILSVVNSLSVPQVGIRFVYVRTPLFSATIIFLKGFVLLQNSLVSPSDSLAYSTPKVRPLPLRPG